MIKMLVWTFNPIITERREEPRITVKLSKVETGWELRQSLGFHLSELKSCGPM